MSETARSDPFADVISLVAGPISAVIRSFDQLRKGADELMRGLENFNTTMETLNETATRINALLTEFEGPVRALMPQVTRTLQAADEITSRLSGPVDDVIPGLTRLADTLNSPVLAALPKDLGAFLDTINELVRRLAPLTQIAESAGGLFGLKLPGFGRPGGAHRPDSRVTGTLCPCTFSSASRRAACRSSPTISLHACCAVISGTHPSLTRALPGSPRRVSTSAGRK